MPTAASRDVPKASVDAFLQELRRVRDGVNEQAAQRRELEKCLTAIKMKDQGGDAVVLTDLCCSLELPIATIGGGMKKADLVEQIIAALLAELPAGASGDTTKAAFVDASLQELRRVRDGLNEQAAQRGALEKYLAAVKVKDQGGDAVGLTDLCRSLELPITKPGGGGMIKAELVEQIIAALLAELPAGASGDTTKTAFADASLQELRRVRDGLNEQAAQRGALEKYLTAVKVKDQGGDAVGLTDLYRSLELPITKPGGRGMKTADLVEQIIAALLAELPAGASGDTTKAAFVDASLQELRRVRDGLNEQAAQRGALEKYLAAVKMKDQGGDAVGLTDLCRSLELPIAKPSGGWMKKAELVEQIVSTLLAEVFAPCSDVDKSSFDMAMELCRSFDESQWDLDSAVRRACNTVESCVCLGSVLMGTHEEELLRRLKGLDYWVEQIV